MGRLRPLAGRGALAGAGSAAAGVAAAGTGGAALAATVAALPVAVGAIGVTAATIAANEMPKIVAERGAGAWDPATGGTTDSNSAAGMAPERPWVREWLKKKAPSVFGAGGSLPPGAAGMPAAPVERLPGLDGRKKAPAPASQVPAAPQADDGALSRLHAQADDTRAKVAAIGAQTVAPQVDTSSIEGVGPKADSAKASIEGLNVTARPTVDVASLQAAEAFVDRLLAKLAQVGSSAAGASSAVRSIPSPAGALRGRSSASFSDGVTPGAGAQ